METGCVPVPYHYDQVSGTQSTLGKCAAAHLQKQSVILKPPNGLGPSAENVPEKVKTIGNAGAVPLGLLTRSLCPDGIG